jgi:hypothetical protein
LHCHPPNLYDKWQKILIANPDFLESLNFYTHGLEFKERNIAITKRYLLLNEHREKEFSNLKVLGEEYGIGLVRASQIVEYIFKKTGLQYYEANE